MKKSEIVKILSSKMNKRVQRTIRAVMKDVNAQGHNFVQVKKKRWDGEWIKGWEEPGFDETLYIFWDLNVGFDDFTSGIIKIYPALQEYLSRIEEGSDPEAEELMRLLGEKYNNRFLRLYEEKGAKFFQDFIFLLKKIGSKSTLNLVEQAFKLLEDNKGATDSFRRIENQLVTFDKRNSLLKEDTFELFERYRGNKD